MQTIGERLEEARKRKGISIREAAESTKIRSDYLHKFESNQFDLNLAEIYVRGFLRGYAQFLRLPAEKILNDYAALGRADSQQRQPGREIYVRLDLNVASQEERGQEKSPADEESSDANPTEASRRPSSLNRSGSSLSKGPSIPPALIFRGGIILAAVLAIAFVVWGITALVSGDSPTDKAPANSSANVVAQSDNSISLIALNSVRVKVTLKNADGSPGDVLLPETNFNRGEVRHMVKNGPILIWASEGKDLQIEIKGKRYPMPFEGYNRAQIN